jgi:spermidine/putrescine transport system permease protein
MAPILLPDVLQGVALLLGFVLLFDAVERVTGLRPSLGRTTIVCAHASFAASYVTLLVRARLRTIPRALEEAALDLGATPAQAFRRVTLPLLLPAVAGGALLSFTLSLDEYVLAFFTHGSGSGTLPIHVASSARKGITPEINALSAILVVASLGLAAAALALQRRSR